LTVSGTPREVQIDPLSKYILSDSAGKLLMPMTAAHSYSVGAPLTTAGGVQGIYQVGKDGIPTFDLGDGRRYILPKGTTPERLKENYRFKPQADKPAVSWNPKTLSLDLAMSPQTARVSNAVQVGVTQAIADTVFKPTAGPLSAVGVTGPSDAVTKAQKNLERNAAAVGIASNNEVAQAAGVDTTSNLTRAILIAVSVDGVIHW
jgi:hypothetical protein